MESNLVLYAKTRNITVTTQPQNMAQFSQEENGTLSVIGGIPAYVQGFIEQHNLDNHAHPNLWYIHEQAVAASTWTIQHNLKKYPSVTVVDSSNTIVTGNVTYIDENSVQLNFNGAFKGKAYLN